MKYIYRPQEVNVEEFEQILSKLEQDYLELLEGKWKKRNCVLSQKMIKDQTLRKESRYGILGLDDPAEMPSDAEWISSQTNLLCYGYHDL